jgi:hypothetical protein
MFFVAGVDLGHGKPLGEVHLITAAPVTLGTSTGSVGGGIHGLNFVLSGVGVPNAIIEADYIAPPDSRPVPRDGLTYPSAWSVTMPIPGAPPGFPGTIYWTPYR